MKSLFYSLFVVSLFLLPQNVMAQGHSIYCEKADSTAATQTCLKRHLDGAQTRLNKVYGELNSNLEADKQVELKDLQQSWLNYRDTECMWEAERSDTPPLKRLNELSCMARLTEDRADILAIVLDSDDQPSMAREYGSFPRWMNVVAKDNPDVFWDYRTRTRNDLDCDGEDEFVIQGVRTSQKTMKKPDEDDDNSASDLTFTKEVVIAIAQNPMIGRPVAQTLVFNVTELDEASTICSDDVDLAYIEASAAVEPHEGAQDEKSETPACTAKLEIKAKGCAAKTVSWTGKNFTLDVEEDPVEKTKE